MGIWKLKGCPRCGGDIFLERDEDRWYEQCLQCSYVHELKDIAEFYEQSGERAKESTLAGETQRRKRPQS